MSEKNVREWWIDQEEKHWPVNAYSECLPGWDKSQFIHVIEKSAFDEAQAEIAFLNVANERATKLNLEFHDQITTLQKQVNIANETFDLILKEVGTSTFTNKLVLAAIQDIKRIGAEKC